MIFTARQGVGSVVPCPLEGGVYPTAGMPYSLDSLPHRIPYPFRYTQHQNQPIIWQFFLAKTAQNERNWTERGISSSPLNESDNAVILIWHAVGLSLADLWAQRMRATTAGSKFLWTFKTLWDPALPLLSYF